MPARLGLDCGIEVITNGFPWSGAIAERIPQEIGTGEIGRSASTTEIDLLIPPSFALADLPIECDCHIAAST